TRLRSLVLDPSSVDFKDLTSEALPVNSSGVTWIIEYAELFFTADIIVRDFSVTI
ncbi:MAG: hypothetical protein GX671_01760, partial [Clostridiales bacterium]|nr:hypothetical protein [Clostridiales bacterium]